MVSIITGGPGTGKTTVQRVILYIHNKLGGKSVLLTAPHRKGKQENGGKYRKV